MAEQVIDRVLGVEIACAIFQVGGAEQDLTDVLVEVGEETLVERHEPDLPDRSRRLLLGDGRGHGSESET